MEEKEQINEIVVIEEQEENNNEILKKEQEKEIYPDNNKPYVMRNFVREIKRVRWPKSRKYYRYFFLIFVFILFLIGFFLLISLASDKFLEVIGAK